MSEHVAQVVNDQVNAILEMFYVDDEFLVDDDEQEDMAFYDLYDEEQEEMEDGSYSEGLWPPILEPDDTDAHDSDADKGNDHEPTSTSITSAQVNRQTCSRKQGPKNEASDEGSDGECVNESAKSDGELVDEGQAL